MSSLFHNPTSSDHIKVNRSDDRAISFQLIDDKKHITAGGIVDPRLFKGTNRLHAQRDEEGLWFLKYESGDIPPALKQRWTHYTRLIDDVEAYYRGRNLSIKRIED